MHCKFCGEVDDHSEKLSGLCHEASPKHQCNLILYNYKNNKSQFTKNRDGLYVTCNAQSEAYENATTTKIDKSENSKVRLYVKPKQKVKFFFNIRNGTRKDDVLIVGVQLAHPQPQFEVTYNPYIFGEEPRNFNKRPSIPRDVSITFCAPDVGQYEMPIIFTFHKPSEDKNIVIIREMIVHVEDHSMASAANTTPYIKKNWDHADKIISSVDAHKDYKGVFPVPLMLKKVLPRGLNESNIENMDETPEDKEQMRIVLRSTREIIDEGPTKENYMMFFHHLLWWEEIIERINIRFYNMSGVTLGKCGCEYVLSVPGLAERRPSLLRGDKVLIRPHENMNVIFASTVANLTDSDAYLVHIDSSFKRYYTSKALFDIRFLINRIPMEIRHRAVSKLFSSQMERLIFPTPNKKKTTAVRIKKFYNNLIKDNPEQKCAVEHITSGTSGRAPYIVFGPPGTGKTMAIVEAIIQLVAKNPNNRILVCAETNKAADHIAVLLLTYRKQLNIKEFLLRANSQSREWSILPSELVPVSNGTSYETFYSYTNEFVASYRILVTTLLHAAKYASVRSQSYYTLKMSHLFIDEAAQASEPSALAPITGLLAQNGHLILAGDPQQLGPVCMARQAQDKGLGTSLMDRLRVNYTDLYGNNPDYNPDYITMLLKNYRSHPDILTIPNELFYENRLQPCAGPDTLTEVSVLGLEGGKRAIVFHAVDSQEQKMGNAPGFYNEKELEMVKKYVSALITVHGVAEKDIGVISPYLRQVSRIKNWITSKSYHDVEVGTVEAFQGKEKRIILVSTVRANSKHLAYDAKYGLGFLVDDKRFNVTVTRAKSKLIIIGNPTCLTKDLKWRKYIELCEQFHCYHGFKPEPVQPNSDTPSVTTMMKALAIAKKDNGKKKSKKKKNASVLLKSG